jgi:hypothetical protein
MIFTVEAYVIKRRNIRRAKDSTIQEEYAMICEIAKKEFLLNSGSARFVAAIRPWQKLAGQVRSAHYCSFSQTSCSK